MQLAGRFIVVDGPDGSGKGTVLEHLAELVAAEGGHCRRARDPGGTEIGDRIRHVLLDFDLSEMAPRCETLLFMASRAQLVNEVVRPALDAGETVLCDRFISATCAYQGAVGVSLAQIIELGRHAVDDLWPDLTVILDVPPEVGFERTGRKPHHATRKGDVGQLSMFDGATPDAMERRPLDYHRKVRQLFLGLGDIYPSRVEVVDASRDAATVWAEVQEVMRRAFD